ncbi:MAG: hypothetical protein Kow00133_02180 [Amphiplicatus sp.]
MRRALYALVAGLACACAPQTGEAETHIVEMRGLEFIPAEIDVAAGDTVTWVNADVMPHTATAADGSWDSGTMEAGDEWSLVIETAGALDYVCAFHPTMTGVINAR